ncbi:hypothetical protein [Mycoplasma todarodis]|uniref:hypothetical protein n=1 Tax=Mycoplasma todarodis TaxID=1937191 RepID=UPI003B2C2181
MKFKKALVNLGVATVATTLPLVAIVSCGKETSKAKTSKNKATEKPSKPSIKIKHTNNKDFPYDVWQTKYWKTLPKEFDFSKIKRIPSEAFYNLEYLPDDVDFSNVEIISSRAFFRLKELPENIVFSSVKEILPKAFRLLKRLPENIDFSSVEIIYTAAFRDLEKFPKNIDFSNVYFLYPAVFPEIKELPEGFNLSKLRLLNKNYNMIAFPSVTKLPKGFKINPEASYKEIRILFIDKLMQQIKPLIKE